MTGGEARPGSRSRAALLVKAPAKVNLGLRVFGRRRDGYHQVRTLLAAVDWSDTLCFEPGGHGVRLECSDPEIPTDGRNLVLKAVSRLEEHLGRRLPGVRIRLEKRIPVGRGLGGGSSDAAAALTALNRLFDLGLRRPTLVRLAARIGMDVPFFLYGGLAVATGRGEQVFPLAAAPELWLVLLLPDFGVATEAAYRSLSSSQPAKNPTASGGPATGRIARSAGSGKAGGAGDRAILEIGRAHV